MRSKFISQPGLAIAVVVLAALIAAGIGAWRNTAPSPHATAEQHAVFVQSGGVAADLDPSLPDASQAFSHARAPSQPEDTAATF